MHDESAKACVAVAPERASAAQIADHLDVDLSNLEQAIADLTDSLAPVLHDNDQPVAPEGDYPIDGAESGLVIRLRNRQYRLRELTDRIYALRSRLEV